MVTGNLGAIIKAGLARKNSMGGMGLLSGMLTPSGTHGPVTPTASTYEGMNDLAAPLLGDAATDNV